MTLDQFRQWAEIWGGDIDRWPQATQASARDIARSDEGLRILAQQLGLDRLLSLAPEVSDHRAQRIGLAVLRQLAKPESEPPWLRWLLRPASLLPAASLACSAVIGLWLAAAAPYQARQEALSVVSMLFDGPEVTLWGVQ